MPSEKQENKHSRSHQHFTGDADCSVDKLSSRDKNSKPSPVNDGAGTITGDYLVNQIIDFRRLSQRVCAASHHRIVVRGCSTTPFDFGQPKDRLIGSRGHVSKCNCGFRAQSGIGMLVIWQRKLSTTLTPATLRRAPLRTHLTRSGSSPSCLVS